MPLVNMQDLLTHAHRHRYAVAAFQVADLAFLAGYIRAAEQMRAPILLHVPSHSRSGIGMDMLLGAIRASVAAAQIPVAIQLDHATSLEASVDGIRQGCNGIMIDGSQMTLADNIALTKAAVEMAHSCGIPVEGELGCIPNAAADVEPELTGVAEAKAFVERTGVDFLAVSIGTLHGRLKGRSRIDTSRLRQINEALAIPLVIHGGTGLEEAQIQRLVANGAAKINFFTALDEIAGKTMSTAKGCYSERLHHTIEALASETEQYIRWCGAAGRAAEVLAQCRTDETVEHLIIYNLTPAAAGRAEELMRIGRKVLAAIPGVQRVFSGRAIKEQDRFQLCWLVRFASREVIASYRDHPAHVAFANHHFRPYADDRVSIDYQDVSDYTTAMERHGTPAAAIAHRP